VFENRMLRRIFGLKRNEVTGQWQTLHNEEFYNLYFSSNIIIGTSTVLIVFLYGNSTRA
jgi:hypothetical protein